MRTITIKQQPKLIHFFIGTQGCMTIHTNEQIQVDDNLKIGDLLLKVESVEERSNSKHYKPMNFYELRFTRV